MPEVAKTFAAIGDRHREYHKAIKARAAVSEWAHFYWAQHVTSVLPAEMPSLKLDYLLLAGRDFALARFARFGVDCEASVYSLRGLPGFVNITAARTKLWASLVSPMLANQCPGTSGTRT